MKKVLLLLSFALSTSPLFAQKDKAAIESMIVKFFDGLTEVDSQILKATTTDDFLLL